MAPVRDLEARTTVLESGAVSVLSFIPVSLHAGIRDGTNTTNLRPYIQLAIDTLSAGVAGNSFAVAFSLHFPRGKYLVGGSVLLSAGKSFRITGAGFASQIYGTVAGYILDHFSTVAHTYGLPEVAGLYVRNTSASASAGGIRLWAAQSHRVDHVRVEVSGGVGVAMQGFSGRVTDSTVVGGAIGIYAGGHNVVENCDVTAATEGLRGSGAGLAVVGGRFEVNRTAIRLGVDEAGADRQQARCSIKGASFEANDTAINLEHVAATSIEGVGIQGSVNSPSAGSVIGIRTNNVTDVVLSGVHVNGGFSTAGIKIVAAPLTSAFIGVTAENTLGAAWDAAGVSLAGAAFIACDPSAPKAGL